MSVALDPSIGKKISIAIVQVGSIEESYRALMALKAVKHLYPETEITVITRPEAAVPFQRVDWLTQVVSTPNLKGLADPVPTVARWINQLIGQDSFDILVNWTWSKPQQKLGALLTSLIPALVKYGDSVRTDLSRISLDAWSIYHHAWANEECEVDQDIHPTDIITTQLLTALQIHLGDPNPEAGVVAVTSKYFFKVTASEVPNEWVSRPKGLRWIAIHYQSLGARAEEWIEIVLRRHPDAGIVILNEAVVDFDAGSPRVMNLSGQMQFDIAVQVLTQCHWLISGPSPLVGLASLLNTRTLQVVQKPGLKWIEQGPYGNTHLVVQFTENQAEEWAPEVVYAYWSHAQSEWFHRGKQTLEEHVAQLGLTAEAAKTRLFKSRIRPAIEGGGVSYEPQSVTTAFEHTPFSQWMFRIRGQMARAWFCGWNPPVEEESKLFQLNPDLLKHIRKQQESIGVLKQVATEGALVARDLQLAGAHVPASYLMSAEDRDGIETLGRKLLELEGLMGRVARVEPSLECFLRMYQGLIGHLRSDDIAGMASETADAFDLIAEGIALLEQYIRRTLELAKPKSVARSASPTADPNPSPGRLDS
jgi:ADP-heptose:LPS heptosyltransferase